MLPNKYSYLISIAVAQTEYLLQFKKVLSYELSTPLYIIFKMSIDSGTCHLLSKNADITPIYKKQMHHRFQIIDQ